jgi:hypothetical protein
MPLGEKLWEDHGRVTSRAVKRVSAEEVVMEISTAGDFKGFGRAAGIDGKFVATGTVESDAKVRRTLFHEVFTTSEGENILIRGYQLGKTEGKRAKSVSTLTFATKSDKLSWVNDLMLVRKSDLEVTQDDFVGEIYEWI